MTLARTVVVCALLLGALIGAPAAPGQTKPSSPGSGASTPAVRPNFQIGSADADIIPAGWRLVHTFDFDERDSGNFESLPRNWYAIGRPPDTSDPNFLRQPLHQQLADRFGYPGYAQVGFDGRQHVSGKESFWMGIHGGSAGAFLEIGTLPAVPGSDYHVTTWVRTTQLNHAKAVLTAYLVDAQGRKIEASEVQASALPGNDQWQWLSVRLLGDYPEAAWIGLELTVRQPDQKDSSALGEHRIIYQDVQGGAWFDDLMVWQVPRVVVGTQSPANIIRLPQRPRLWVHVRDFSVRVLRVRVRVYDHQGKLVDEMARSLGDSQAGR
ncbi:MAG: hypothetical protein IT441_04515, partial [Phycisphaeraceae bacterium]|nr:hypothetical protein [Phycisphaeraceae bacterium]